MKKTLIIIALTLVTLFSFGQTTEFGDSKIELKENVSGSQMTITVISKVITDSIYVPDFKTRDSVTGKYAIKAIAFQYQVGTSVKVNSIGGDTECRKEYMLININNGAVVLISSTRELIEMAYSVNGIKYYEVRRRPKLLIDGTTYSMMKRYSNKKPECFY